jgi:hypothetical protein
MLRASLTVVDEKELALAALDLASKVKLDIGKIDMKKLRPAIGLLLTKALNSSPTVESLRSGSLRDDLGLYGDLVDQAIDGIIKVLVKNISIEQIAAKKGNRIQIKIMPEDINELINVPGSSYETEEYGSIPWLEWLLTKGSRVILSKFWIFPHAKGSTRSGGKKVMQKISNNPRDPFRVDPSHSGTRTNNFITRAIDTVYDDIVNLINIGPGAV